MSNSSDANDRFSISAPADWEEADGVLGTVVTLIGPAEEGDFRPNFNVVAESSGPPVSLDVLRAGHAAAVLPSLSEPRLIDEGFSDVAGHRASRVLVAHASDGLDLTLEQWMLPVGARTVVLSATAATLDYSSVLPTFLEILGSLDFDG